MLKNIKKLIIIIFAFCLIFPLNSLHAEEKSDYYINNADRTISLYSKEKMVVQANEATITFHVNVVLESYDVDKLIAGFANCTADMKALGAYDVGLGFGFSFLETNTTEYVFISVSTKDLSILNDIISTAMTHTFDFADGNGFEKDYRFEYSAITDGLEYETALLNTAKNSKTIANKILKVFGYEVKSLLSIEEIEKEQFNFSTIDVYNYENTKRIDIESLKLELNACTKVKYSF